MSDTSSPKVEIPRQEHSGFRRAAQTPRKRLKFPVLSSLKDRRGKGCPLAKDSAEHCSAWPGQRPVPTRTGGRRSTGWLRWLKFNFVGGIGIGVQLAALTIFRSLLHFDYLLATGLAVETAVLHNFLWHERFTWADRSTSGIRQSLFRLAKFNLSNGALSIAGNLLVMRLLVGEWRLNYVAANLTAVAVCSLVNFLLSDLFVFQRAVNAPPTLE
jgi:putative flippase GtrA